MMPAACADGPRRAAALLLLLLGLGLGLVFVVWCVGGGDLWHIKEENERGRARREEGALHEPVHLYKINSINSKARPDAFAFTFTAFTRCCVGKIMKRAMHCYCRRV